MTKDPNQGIHDIWNGAAGKDWADNQRALDCFLHDAMDQVLAQLPLRPGARVLEIGSGAGTLSMMMARAVRGTGAVLGLDVSHELIALARRRVAAADLGNATFRNLDIQSEPLDETGFDICTAQFGMMFFSDPERALGQIRQHLGSGAVMAFNGWADAGNPWFSLPLEVAEGFLGKLPGPPQDGPPPPGPMAFSDLAYVAGVLKQAGFQDIDAWHEDIRITHPGGLAPLMHSIQYVGPVSALYRLTDPATRTRDRIADDTRKAFEVYLQPDGSVSLPGRVSMFRCTAP